MIWRRCEGTSERTMRENYFSYSWIPERIISCFSWASAPSTDHQGAVFDTLATTSVCSFFPQLYTLRVPLFQRDFLLNNRKERKNPRRCVFCFNKFEGCLGIWYIHDDVDATHFKLLHWGLYPLKHGLTQLEVFVAFLHPGGLYKTIHPGAVSIWNAFVELFV